MEKIRVNEKGGRETLLHGLSHVGEDVGPYLGNTLVVFTESWGVERSMYLETWEKDANRVDESTPNRKYGTPPKQA